MSSIPSTSREVKLKSFPKSLPQAHNFEIVGVPTPTPASGEVLVRNRYTRAAASLRMMISEGAENVEGVPFPALHPGDTLAEESLGEVLTAPAGSGISAGDLVLHHFGWREYAAVPVRACTVVKNELPDPVAHLSHGWTAYAALTRAARVGPGDTVLVTSAAGAIGSMAGQIARLLGAGRVIGSTGSGEKADRLVRELGYDAAVLRGSEPMAQQLSKAAPGGIDVVIDNVGGEQLEAAVLAASEGARVIVMGALSGQLASSGTGRRAPVQLDSFLILLKKLVLRGYSADDHPEARDEWTTRFAQWLRCGEISFPHVVSRGIDTAPDVLEGVAEGRYFGTVVVEF
jgi:2-alkenal reductase